MASILVIQLSSKSGLDASKLMTHLSAQSLSCEDMFIPQPDDFLNPDTPPVLTPMCLPGTSRRPLKVRISPDDNYILYYTFYQT